MTAPFQPLSVDERYEILAEAAGELILRRRSLQRRLNRLNTIRRALLAQRAELNRRLALTDRDHAALNPD